MSHPSRLRLHDDASLPREPSRVPRRIPAGRHRGSVEYQPSHGQDTRGASCRIRLDGVAGGHGQAGDGLVATVEMEIGGAIVARADHGDVDRILDLVAANPKQAIVEALAADDDVAGDGINSVRLF